MVVGIQTCGDPAEVGCCAADPAGVFPPVPLVRGVHLDRARDLVLGSDGNTGLWIVRPTGLPDL